MIRHTVPFLFALIFALAACDDESSFAPRATRDSSDDTRSSSSRTKFFSSESEECDDCEDEYSSSSEDSSNSEHILIDTICGNLWCGSRHDYRARIGIDTGANLSGYWFVFNDTPDSGASKIIWPVEMEAEEGVGAFDPVIDYCEGICGRFVLDKGAMNFDPYVGIAFNVAGPSAGDTDIPANVDVSEWEGLCIAYYLDMRAYFQLWPGENDGDVPQYTLPASDTGTILNIPWSDFRQAGWGRRTLSGPEVAKGLVAIRIMIQAKTGDKGTFNIKTIGRYNSCK